MSQDRNLVLLPEAGVSKLPDFPNRVDHARVLTEASDVCCQRPEPSAGI
jgi:hypothetical protein